MANTFGQAEEKDKTEWHNNKEMNPAANSSVTDEGFLESDKQGDTSWRDEDVNKQSGDPGRTPGKAEEEDDPAYTNS
jgi:hypothetical protein